MAADGGATWHGIVMDTNMPPEGTPWFDTMIAPPVEWEIFIQPGGLDEGAENLNWLPQTAETLKLPIDHPDRLAQGRRYYERLARSNNENWVKRYVHAQYGPDPSGTAVFSSSFRSGFHCVDDLEPLPNLPLYVGQDFGRDPWSIICPPDYMGRLLVLQEVKAEDIGLITHLRQSLRPTLQTPRYLGRPLVVIGDPAGRAKSQYDEVNAFDILKREGFTAIPAGTNDLDTRLRCVEKYLLEQRNGGPAILFSRRGCPHLIQGMTGHYRYSKTQLDISKPTPDKNRWSHVADALQYVALATQGNTKKAITRQLAPRRPPAQRVSAMGWT